MAESHPNRLPGADVEVRSIAQSTETSIQSWWERLNLLSQDIWHSKDDPQYKVIAAKAGELAVEHAMDLSTTLRDIGEIVETLLPGMPEGEAKTQLIELLQHSAKIRA